ncbi:hypothetical protein JZ751_027616, partial [Albula glossodonta]
MAASIWVSSVLRITLRGPSPALALAGGRQLSHLARPAGTCQALAQITNTTVTTPITALSSQQIRHNSFFNKLTADQLWRGVLAESGAGARKGRGKRTKRKMKKDLNRGQFIGEGRGGFLWPGLNVPLVSGTVQSISKRDTVQQEEMQANRMRQRDEWDRLRKARVKRERGWTGRSWGGISLGPPDPGPNG